MTNDQIVKADEWRIKHKDHVRRLMEHARGAYEPSTEDIGSPELWKGPHWLWFIANM